LAVPERASGSRFWIRIRADVVHDKEECRNSVRASNFENNGVAPERETRQRVLVVEDNVTNRVVIESLLKKLGVQVQCVGNGEEAVAAVMSDQQFDTVLMDCQMPIMDGYAATEKIRQRESELGRKRLPIIALTASAYGEDRDRCLAVGMDDFLTKPVKLNELREALEKWSRVSKQPSGPSA
jgi:CheY-like chemotaxis protein